MTVFVDSDILIEVSRGGDAHIDSKWMNLSTADAAVLFANQCGGTVGWPPGRMNIKFLIISSSSELHASCMPIDEATGRLAGLYLRQYSRSHSVEVTDAFIAVSAIASRRS